MVSLVFVSLLAALPLGHPAQQEAPPASFKDYERQPYQLPEEEFLRLRERVMSRCHVAPGTDPLRAPWYFHYELGLELADKDPQRALDALIEAVGHRPEPGREARMYGMWFIAYRPYFEIAKLHVALGNWECAADALRIVAATHEVTSGEKDFRELLELEETVRARKNP